MKNILFMLQQIVKRGIDIVSSLSGMILLTPALLCIGLLIRWKMGSPILFRQQRPGKYGKPFIFYKFRTMTDARMPGGTLRSDAERLTSLGKFLRRWSLDELPQIWNVLCGDMSLVGPRPLLMEYLDLYTPEQARRHEMKPGITGWAQIHGRNAITWEEKFTLDHWYVTHWSLSLDMQILWATVKKVFQQEGISASDHATMPSFKLSKTLDDKTQIEFEKAA
jgi:sugar transferase EpsL